jgi:hypothetical protein
MRRFLRHRPSPATVIACIALAVALGGTSYAAVSLPRGSVGSAQLKKNAVVSSKVKNRSLLAIDFKRGQLPRGARGPQGLPGATGATGATGAKGDKGDTGAAGSAAAYALVNVDGTVVAAQAKNIASANVTRDIVGTYCFSGLSFAPTNILATINGNTGGGAGDAQGSIFAPSDDPTSVGCPAGAQAVVYTVDNATFLADFVFYVAFN